MAIYTAILPNGQPYQIQGPEGASAEDIQAAGLQLYTQRNPAPFVDSGKRDYTLGQAASKGLSRGTERIKSAFGDVIPAMVGSAIGADEYAAKQMKEAQASQELVNRKYRAELQSYKDVQSIGDAIKFGIETVSEQIPNLATMVVPGAAAPQLARVGALKMAPAAFAKRQATAQGIGVYLGSYALNTPEVFQNIYEETGELATGTSLLFGAAAASLDAVLPNAILKNLTPLQKLGISKAVIKKSGARPGLVESVFKGLAKGSATEGVTEGMQEAISISAENFVAGNPQIFDSEDWDRIMESSVRGAVAGGAFRGVSSPLERAPAEPTIPPVVTPEVVVDPLAEADTTEVIPEIEAAPVETETGPITPPVETEVTPVETGTGTTPTTPVETEAVPTTPVETGTGATPTTTQGPYTPEEILKIRDKERGELGIKEEDMTYTEKTNNPNYEGSEIEKGNKFRVVEEITPPEGQQGDIVERLYTWNSNTFKWENKIPADEVSRLKAKANMLKDLNLKILNLTEEESLVDKNGVKIALPKSVAYSPSGKPKKTYNQLAQDSSGNLYQYGSDTIPSDKTWTLIRNLTNVKREAITPADIQKDDKGNVVKKKNKSGWWSSVFTRDLTPEEAAEDAGYQYLPETNQAYDPETDETFNWLPVAGNSGRGAWGGAIPGKPKATPKATPKAEPKATPKAKPLPKNTKPEVAWATFNKEIPYKELDKDLQSRIKDALADNYFDAPFVNDIVRSHRNNKIAEKNKTRVVTKDSITEDSTRGQVGTPATKGRVNTYSSAQEMLQELRLTFGGAVDRMIKKGRLYIADTANDVPNRFLTRPGIPPPSRTNAYFMWPPGKDRMLNGVTVIMADRVSRGDARKLLLHEIGEHYGLEVLLGKDYMPTLLQLNKLKNTDPVVAEAWASVLSRYVPQLAQEGDQTFLSEVAARIGESAPENTWWKKFVAKVKNGLRRLGFYDPEKVTSADIQDFIINSLDRALAEPGQATPLRDTDRRNVRDSIANEQQEAVFDKVLDNKDAGPNIGTYDPTLARKTLDIAGDGIKAIQEGTPEVINTIRNKLSNLPTFLRNGYQGLLGLPAMIGLYGRELPSLKKLMKLLELRAGKAMQEREYIDVLGNIGMDAIKGKKRLAFKLYKKTKDKEGKEIKGAEVTIEDFKDGKSRTNNEFIVERIPRTEVTEKYTTKQINEWNDIVYELSTTSTKEFPQGIDPTDPANSELDIVKDFYNKTPKELQLVSIMYASQFNQFANQFNANVLKLLPDTTKSGEAITPSQKRDIFKTQLINNQLVFYQPLKRSGNWRIEFVPKGSTELSVERFKTAREMQQRLVELNARGAESIDSTWVPETAKRKGDVPTDFFQEVITTLEEGLAPKKRVPVLDKAGQETRDVNGELVTKLVIDPDKKMETAHEQMIDDIYGFYIDMFPSSSVRQSTRGREGTAGFEKDIVGGFIDVGAKMANQVTNMKYVPLFGETLASIQEEAKTTGREMIRNDDTLSTQEKEKQQMLIAAAANDIAGKGHSFLVNPVAGPIAGTLSYISFYTTIAGNVSSALVNLTQVLIIVIPGLVAKHGVVNGLKAFNEAFKLYMSGGWDNNKGFAPDVSFAMKDGVRRSQENADRGLIKQEEVISQELLDLYDYGVQNSVFKRGLGYELTEMRQKNSQDFTGNRAKVEGLLGWMFQNTERFNREVTFASSFLADRKAGKSVKESTEMAQDFTRESHGTALPEIGPRYFQSGWGKTMFTFKRYGHAMLSLIAKLFYQGMKGNIQAQSDIANEIAKLGTDPANKEQRDVLYKELENLKEIKRVARKQLLGIYGVSFTVAGLQGMPLYGATNVLAEMINAMFDDEDDEFFDFDESVRDMFGEIGYKGPLNKLLNLDIASRTGFSNLIFRDDSRRLGEVGLPTYLLEMSLGPSFSYALSMQRAVTDFNQGNLYRAGEQVLPAFLRNPMKAIRYANEGARNRAGVELTPLNGFDAFMQVFGFTNEDLSNQYERNNTLKRAERKILDRRNALLTAAFLSYSTGDDDSYEVVMDQIEKFNESEGGKRNPITSRTIKSSRKGRERAVEESMNGVSISKKYRDYLQKELGS